MSWWTVAFQALGSALSSSSSSRSNSRQQADNDRRNAEMSAAQQRNLAMWMRGNELEDRRYRQEAMGNYAQFSTLQGVERVPYSSTTPTPIALPTPVDPRNRPRNGQQGPMFYT